MRRSAGGQLLLVLLNMTPEPLPGYALAVPAGCYQLELNSDQATYGGSDYPSGQLPGDVFTARISGAADIETALRQDMSNPQPYQLFIDLPPLCGLVWRHLTPDETIQAYRRKTHGSK